MAIKIGGQDLQKRYIGGQEVVKVMLNGGEIRPSSIPPTPSIQPTYHIVGDFTQGSMPTGWQTYDGDVEPDGFIGGKVFYSDFGPYKFTNLGKIEIDLDFYVSTSWYTIPMRITFGDASSYTINGYLSFRDLPVGDYHLHLEITDLLPYGDENPYTLTGPDGYISTGSWFIRTPNKDNITIMVDAVTYLKNVTINVWKYPVFSVNPAIASRYLSNGQIFYLDILDMGASGTLSTYASEYTPSEKYPIIFLNITHPTVTTTRVLCVVDGDSGYGGGIKAATGEYETSYELYTNWSGWIPEPFNNTSCRTLGAGITLSGEYISCATYGGDSFAETRFAENTALKGMVGFGAQYETLVDEQDIATIELYNNQNLIKTVNIRSKKIEEGGYLYRDVQKSINGGEWEDCRGDPGLFILDDGEVIGINRMRVYPRPGISLHDPSSRTQIYFRDD